MGKIDRKAGKIKEIIDPCFNFQVLHGVSSKEDWRELTASDSTLLQVLSNFGRVHLVILLMCLSYKFNLKCCYHESKSNSNCLFGHFFYLSPLHYSWFLTNYFCHFVMEDSIVFLNGTETSSILPNWKPWSPPCMFVVYEFHSNSFAILSLIDNQGILHTWESRHLISLYPTYCSYWFDYLLYLRLKTQIVFEVVARDLFSANEQSSLTKMHPYASL